MVALAPEESIYVMEANRPGFQKLTKAEALNSLTVGVPTMSIDYEGRRQVFAESEHDARIYTLLYGILRAKLPVGRSLEFISTGPAKGCAQVYEWVDRLQESGNRSIFGIVDADISKQKKNQERGRIFVMADNTRDGLENLILDPLLLAAFVCHRHRTYLATIGLNQGATLGSLLNAPVEQLQRTVEQ